MTVQKILSKRNFKHQYMIFDFQIKNILYAILHGLQIYHKDYNE